jgi:hypothetical protein
MLTDKRKSAKLQWFLQNPKRMEYKQCKTYQNDFQEEEDYLNDKIDDLEIKSRKIQMCKVGHRTSRRR